ncbi:MAG TPA: hypothetical protein DHV92_07805 [Ruminococcaceae bacterium]|jgi:hypothetical protein|nr:hypothetical protein [Acutalibacteraceae bacterium]HCJ93205.1 hypothetical protein [Oscillospiraceae bacterium]
MRPEEDKDIKVFHPSNEKKEQAEESTDLSQDILHAVQELDAQRSNGNLRRARKLGRSLAQFTPENAAKLGGIDIKAKGGVDPQELPSNVLYQARVLMLFTAQLTLHRLLPPVISNEAVNAMYDDLSEGFYDNVMEGASFSIYYLAVRKAFNISANIGKGFAMLCGDEDSDEYAKIGMLVYNLSDEYVTRRVNEAGFKKLS